MPTAVLNVSGKFTALPAGFILEIDERTVGGGHRGPSAIGRSQRRWRPDVEKEPRCPTRAITLNPQRYCAWRDAMDEHGQLEYATASGNDYVGHEQMYRSFVTLTRSAAAVIVVILILMAIFLT
jgi:hypothetical protein